MTAAGENGSVSATAAGHPVTAATAATATSSTVDAAVLLGEHLVGAWGSWSPTMTPDADRMAFISDRSGTPSVWVQDVVVGTPLPEATSIWLSNDPVTAVSWSADSAWLACAVATDGGVRSQVWVVRPDGSDARRIAGSHEQHAELGPWTRSGHRVVVTIPSTEIGEPTTTYLVDPATGAFEHLAVGELIHVLDLSVGEELVVIRDGRRGHEFCVVVDRVNDLDHPLLPRSAAATVVAAAHEAAAPTALLGATGATEVALLRPAPEGADALAELGASAPLVAYLATEVGAQRHRLVALPLGPNGWRGVPQVLAERDDAELEGLDADDAGRLLLMVWNRAGTSEIELFDTTTGVRIGVPELPGFVASSPVLSRDGGTVILSVEGPERPRELWRLDTATHEWARVSQVPEFSPPQIPGAASAAPALPALAVAAAPQLVVPTLERYEGRDGLPLTGWLYRVPGSTAAGPAMLSLHGGPESQERPTFNPQYQAMLAAGIAVFAPNVRGSSGFGRTFSHLDDLHGRQGAFDDVLASAEHLVALGVADARRIAVTGRSYGGYLTLASLAFSPGVFAAGIDICGMSHLLTFYRDTEPWIAAAAVTKYGHPEHDQKLLRAISPLPAADRIDAPLLVVHGELDTNVPIGEAHQIVAALRALDRPVEYLELAGEGHEYRRADSRRLLVATMVRFLTAAL